MIENKSKLYDQTPLQAYLLKYLKELFIYTCYIPSETCYINSKYKQF